jgi:hypothetical protein
MHTDATGARWTLVNDEALDRVRRFPVPGGWLYQVEKTSPLGDQIGWHRPVFVADSRAW